MNPTTTHPGHPGNARQPLAPFRVIAWSLDTIAANTLWTRDAGSHDEAVELATDMVISREWIAVRVYAHGCERPRMSWTAPDAMLQITWTKTVTYSGAFDIDQFVNADEEGVLGDGLLDPREEHPSAFVTISHPRIREAQLLLDDAYAAAKGNRGSSISAQALRVLDWVHTRPSSDGTDWEVICVECETQLLLLDGYGMEPDGTSLSQQAKAALDHAPHCPKRPGRPQNPPFRPKHLIPSPEGEPYGR